MKKTVLVVDDEPGVGRIVSIMLRFHGFEVIVTGSGAEAINLVRTREPDVILLDVFMPDVSGMDVLEKVRTFSQIPIIMFTARHEFAQQARMMGANDFVSKPFHPDQLVKKIRSLLNRQTEADFTQRELSHDPRLRK